MSPLTNYLKPAAFVIFPQLGGLFGPGFTIPNQQWYRSLIKAPWNPPEWVFGPVWTALYTGMGYASWLVYKEVGFRNTPMYLYGAQLVINWVWSHLFFGAHRIGLSCLDLVAMLGVAAVCTKEFHKVNPWASRLMLPYLGWLSLALTLNFYMWLYNGERE